MSRPARRVRGAVLHIPVIHGSVAIPLGPRATDTRTHEWSIYLRPMNALDLSHLISRVEFCLHDSFDPPTRTVKSVPYEIHESGWGEFEAVIKVYFMDPTEKMVEFFHPLRLFPLPPTDKDAEVDPLAPVVSEFYDEIVFQDPSEKMYNLLKSTPVGNAGVSHLPVSALQPYFQDFSNHESMSLKKIEQARRRVHNETVKRQNRFEKLQTERAQLLREISSRGGDV